MTGQGQLIIIAFGAILMSSFICADDVTPCPDHIDKRKDVKSCLELLVKNGDKLECHSCRRCPAGKEPFPPCHTGKVFTEGTFVRKCTKCQDGFFKETDHGEVCSPAACQSCNSSHCPDGKIVLAPCTKKHAEICSSNCIPGYYKDFLEQCVPCCPCFGPKDKRETKCSGYPGKQCESVNGKCRQTDPKSSKLTSISMVSRSSWNHKNTASETSVRISISTTLTTQTPHPKILKFTQSTTSSSAMLGGTEVSSRMPTKTLRSKGVPASSVRTSPPDIKEQKESNNKWKTPLVICLCLSILAIILVVVVFLVWRSKTKVDFPCCCKSNEQYVSVRFSEHSIGEGKAGCRWETWDDIKKKTNVMCWNNCSRPLNILLSKADPHLETVIDKAMRANRNAQNLQELCTNMFKFYRNIDDHSVIENAKQLLYKLHTLRPELSVGQFVYVAKSMSLNNVVKAVHDQLHG